MNTKAKVELAKLREQIIQLKRQLLEKKFQNDLQEKEINQLKFDLRVQVDVNNNLNVFVKALKQESAQLSKIKGVDAEQLWDSNCYRASLADMDQLMMPKSGFLTAIHKLLNP